MDEELNLPKPIDKNDAKVLAQQMKKTSKIEEIENETALYVKDAFNIVRNRQSFLDRLESELESRMSELTVQQLIALVSNETVNVNDQMNKVLAPTSTILTEKQRTEQAQQQQQVQQVSLSQNNIGALNQQTPTNILQGLQQFFQLQSSTQQSIKNVEDGQTTEESGA